MRILALDLATESGWAFAGPGEVPVFGTWSLAKRHGMDSLGERFSLFTDLLSDRIADTLPNVIAYEAPIPVRSTEVVTNFQTTRLLYGLIAIAEMLAVRFDCVKHECHVGRVKKHLAGHGFAQKIDMIRACQNRGWFVASDHEADALGVLESTAIDLKHRGAVLPKMGPKAAPTFVRAA